MKTWTLPLFTTSNLVNFKNTDGYYCLIICFFTGDLVALFDDDDIDELKQERNEVEYRKSKSWSPGLKMKYTSSHFPISLT